VSVHKQVSGTTSLNLTKYHVHVTYGHGSVLYDTLCTGTLGFMNDVTTFVDRLYSLCMVLVVFLVTTTAGDKSIIIIVVIIIIIIINENYYSVVVSKKLQEHLTTEKIKPTTVSRRLRTVVRLSEIKRAAEEQCLQPSLEGDQRWRRDDVRQQTVPNASCGDCESAVADGDAT